MGVCASFSGDSKCGNLPKLPPQQRQQNPTQQTHPEGLLFSRSVMWLLGSCHCWPPPSHCHSLQRWSQYLPPHLSLNHFLEADCPSAWLERRELVSRWEQQCRQGTSLSFRAHWPHPTVRPSPQLPTVHPALVLLAILLFCCLFLSPRAQTVAGRSDGRSSRVGFIWTTAFGNV